MGPGREVPTSPGDSVTNSKEQVMRRIVFGLLVGAVASTAPVSGQPDGEAAPIYGIKYLQGYRDWHLISVKRLTGKQLTGTGAELRQLRAELGNDLAIKAFRDGTLPFPDGAMIAAVHWNEDSSDADDKALAAGFPGAGLHSTFAGAAVNVQFMVKELEKICRIRRLGICRLHERQTWQRGAARDVLPLPRARKRPRLRFYALRADALKATPVGKRNPSPPLPALGSASACFGSSHRRRPQRRSYRVAR